MTEKEIIQKIQKLKSIQPSPAWLSLTRQNLIKQTSQLIRSERMNWSFFDGLFGLKGYFKLGLIMSGVLIFLIGGPWLVIKVSQASLPGELLYSVKRITEQIQIKVAPEETKAQLQVEFASRRLEELNKLHQDSFSPEEKSKKAEQVVSDFQNNLVGVSLHLSKISKEKAMVMAKKTKELKENLIKTKEEAPLAVQKKLTEAEKVVEEINHQILTVLVGKEEEIDEIAPLIDEETLIFLEEERAESENPINETTTEMLIN